MKQILTINMWSELPDDWETVFPWDALSVKPKWASRAAVWLPKGKDLHLWDWAYFTTRKAARAAGEAAARACIKWKAKRYYLDGEKDWADSDEPFACLLEFLAGWFAGLGDSKVELAYNGFSWTHWKGKKLHDKETIKCFHVWCPMLYQVSRADLTASFKDKLHRYDIPGQVLAPMLYAGRYSGGVYHGAEFSLQKELLLEHKVEEVAWWFGDGSKSRYFEFAELCEGLASGANVPTNMDLYTIRPGDSWWGIAQRRLGNGNLYKALKLANPGVAMVPGNVLELTHARS